MRCDEARFRRLAAQPVEFLSRSVGLHCGGGNGPAAAPYFTRRFFFAFQANAGKDMFHLVFARIIRIPQPVIPFFKPGQEDFIFLRAKQSLHNLLPFVGSGKKEPAKIPLRQKHDLSELLRLEPEKPLNFSRNADTFRRNRL